MSSNTSKPALGLTRFWWGKCEGKRLAIPRRRWEDNIRMGLQEMWWGRGILDWVDLAEDRDKWRALVNTLWAFGFR